MSHLWVACSTYPRLLRTKIIHHEFLDLRPREAPIIDSVLYPKHTSWLIIVKWFLKLKVLRWYRRWYLSNLIYDQPTRLGEMCTKEKTEKMRHSFFSPFKDLLANQISKSFYRTFTIWDWQNISFDDTEALEREGEDPSNWGFSFGFQDSKACRSLKEVQQGNKKVHFL